MSITTAVKIWKDARGRAWIDTTNTKVTEVVLNKQSSGLTPQQIHSDHPHLSLAQIEEALAYYEEHRADIDSQIQRDLAEAEELRAQSGESPFVQRMKAEGRLP